MRTTRGRTVTWNFCKKKLCKNKAPKKKTQIKRSSETDVGFYRDEETRARVSASTTRTRIGLKSSDFITSHASMTVDNNNIKRIMRIIANYTWVRACLSLQRVFTTGIEKLDIRISGLLDDLNGVRYFDGGRCPITIRDAGPIERFV